mmetsp:Transcript_54291/g.154642  ORF Transcript_54291/g.154642 Transcript_54291/m.154642 type:complete len:206 (+) Transcript_54291:193-810(+)
MDPSCAAGRGPTLRTRVMVTRRRHRCQSCRRGHLTGHGMALWRASARLGSLGSAEPRMSNGPRVLAVVLATSTACINRASIGWSLPSVKRSAASAAAAPAAEEAGMSLAEGAGQRGRTPQRGLDAVRRRRRGRWRRGGTVAVGMTGGPAHAEVHGGRQASGEQAQVLGPPHGHRRMKLRRAAMKTNGGPWRGSGGGAPEAVSLLP